MVSVVGYSSRERRSSSSVAELRADLAVFRTTIRNWAVAAVLASAALAFTIAKFVH